MPGHLRAIGSSRITYLVFWQETGSSWSHVWLSKATGSSPITCLVIWSNRAVSDDMSGHLSNKVISYHMSVHPKQQATCRVILDKRLNAVLFTSVVILGNRAISGYCKCGKCCRSKTIGSITFWKVRYRSRSGFDSRPNPDPTASLIGPSRQIRSAWKFYDAMVRTQEARLKILQNYPCIFKGTVAPDYIALEVVSFYRPRSEHMTLDWKKYLSSPCTFWIGLWSSYATQTKTLPIHIFLETWLVLTLASL